MIQVHGKTILSMEFKSIIKARDSNPWQFIHQKPNSHWQHQSPIPIGNIKAQFSLALLYQKEKSPRLSTLGKEKISCYRSKKGPWQLSYEETH